MKRPPLPKAVSPPATLAQVLVDELCVKAPQIKIVLFAMDEAPDSFLSAVHLGVRGYVLKDLRHCNS